jgi:hypothetical protein
MARFQPRKLNHFWIKGHNMSKGGAPDVSTTAVDPDIKEAFLANFQNAQGVAGALPTQQFAGFNPLYQAGEEALVNTALAGPGIAGTDLAAQMSAYGGMYQPAQQTAGQANLGMTGPGNIASYMNPYTSQVRTNALADLESARRSAVQQTGERAMQARAFGGSRQGVAEALTNAGFAKQAGTLGTQLNENAFNQAVQLQAADLARAQQAAAANQAAGLQGAQVRLAGAGQLGSLAQQQQALRLGGAQAVMGAGGARQAADQQQIDAIRNIGLQRLGIVQSSLGASPANLGGTVATPMYSNPAAGALGGALAGAQLGSVVPGIGTAVGAIGGGLLGLLS